MKMPGFGKESNSGKKSPKLDAKVRRLLGIMDELLARLPNEEIEKFSESRNFRLYEGVMKKYGIKEQKT